MNLLLLALAPVFALLGYIYWRDRYEREPLKYLIVSFILGALAAFPVVFLGRWLEGVTGASMQSTDPVMLAMHAFVVVALVEEGMKFLALTLYMYPKQEFDEPYDGIMYAVAVSLGFAGLENVLYVFGSQDSVSVGIMRMFTAVPGHAMFAVIMGYFVGRAKFQKSGSRLLTMLVGLAGAVLFHGFYDYCLFLGDTATVIAAFASLVVGILLGRKALKYHNEASPHRR